MSDSEVAPVGTGQPSKGSAANEIESQTLSTNVKVLGWSSLFNDIASEAIFPLLPSFIIELGGSRTLIGLMEGTADSAASLLKIWMGVWSDRVGCRKPFIVAGYTIAGLARPMVAMASSAWHVLLVRICDRIGKGLRTAPRDALIAESTPKQLHGWAFGYHRSMDHLGAAIGPLLAAAFLYFLPNHLRLLMALMLIPGVLVLALQYRLLKEQTLSHSSKRHRWVELPQGDFRWYLMALLIFTFANSTDAFLLVRATELGVSVKLLPILWAAFGILKSVGNRFGGRFADHYSPLRLIMAGWLVYIVIYLLFGLASEAWHIWLLFAGYAGFFALTEPAEKKLVAHFARDGKSGAAFGYFHTILGIANLPSSLLFGWIYQTYGAPLAFAWGAAMALLAMLVLTQVTHQDPTTS